MQRAILLALVAIFVAFPRAAHAHPAPFTYLDVRLIEGRLEVAIVAHVFDVAHDLQIDPPDRLLAPATVGASSEAIVALLSPRLRISAAGQDLTTLRWSVADALPDRQSIRIRTEYAMPSGAGAILLTARMFPYDPAHQTFVNVYERDELTLQALLDASKPELEYFLGSRQGRLALARRFIPSGFRHVAFGLEHLLFLAGLALLGGSRRTFIQFAIVFVGANLLSYSLAAFDLLTPPARIIEPAIALAVVYIGADNLMVRGGRDMRLWIAAAFVLIHGFWFANGLRVSDLPPRTLSWSLFCFDVGVQIAQALGIALFGGFVLWLYEKSASSAQRLASIGSVVVIAGGVYWFVQRVFFPGGF